MPTQTICTDCDSTASTKDTYCSECGAGPDPWEERETYDFERDVDLPLVFAMTVGSEDWELWYAFAYKVWDYPAETSDVANLTIDYKSLFKYSRTTLYYKMDESHEIQGPFLDKSAAREA